MATQRICSIPGCGKPFRARGWCNRHWERWRDHGDPLAGRAGWGSGREEIERAILHATPDKCWDWPYGLLKTGYACIAIDGKTVRAHRYVCIRVHGQPPIGSNDAAHNCGNRKCINPHHLRFASRRENIRDTFEHGTSNRGGRQGTPRLTEDDVRNIRKAYASGGVTHGELATQYGMSKTQIQRICSRKRWGWLVD